MLCAIIKLDEGKEWYFDAQKTCDIHDKLMKVTKENYAVSVEASAWCSFAEEDDIFEFQGGKIEIKSIGKQKLAKIKREENK